MRKRTDKERRAMFSAMGGRKLTVRKKAALGKKAVPAGRLPRGERLLKLHEGLVRSVASKVRRRFPTAEMDDLMQEGRLGLLRARDLYKKAKGARFSTFAVPHIRTRAQRAAQKSHLMRVPEKRLFKGERTVRLTGESAQRKLDRATEGGISAAHARASLARLTKRLPQLEKRLLSLRYSNGGLTLRAIAKKLRKSVASVHALERRALARLREQSMT